MRLTGIVLLVAVLAVSGCVGQQPAGTNTTVPDETAPSAGGQTGSTGFSDANLQIVSMDYFDLNGTQVSRDEYVKDACFRCKQWSDCATTPIIKYSVTPPSGYSVGDDGYTTPEIICNFSVDGRQEEYMKQWKARQGVSGAQFDIRLGARLDRTITIQVCCSNTCKSRSLPALC